MQINNIHHTQSQTFGSIYRIQHTNSIDKISFDKYLAPLFIEEHNEPAIFILGKNPLEETFHKSLSYIANKLGGSTSWLKLNMQKFGRKAPSTEDTTSWVITGFNDINKITKFKEKNNGPKITFADKFKLMFFGPDCKDIPQHLIPIFKILDYVESATPKFEKYMSKNKIIECTDTEDFAFKFLTDGEV